MKTGLFGLPALQTLCLAAACGQQDDGAWTAGLNLPGAVVTAVAATGKRIATPTAQ
jgi:hypothetical protein